MAGTLSYAAGPSSDRGELSASAAFAVGREADPTAGQGVGPLPGTGSAESAASPDEPKKRTALENKVSFTGPMLRSKSGERRSVDALVFSTSGRYHSATKQHHLGLPGYAYSRRHKKGENEEWLSALLLCLGFLVIALFCLRLAGDDTLKLQWLPQLFPDGMTADCVVKATGNQEAQKVSQGASKSPAASRFLVEPYSVRGPVPWAHLSPETRRDFTLDYRVPVRHFFKNSTGDIQDLSHLWKAPVIDALVARAATRNASSLLCSYGVACNEAVFRALTAYPIEGQSVLVVGSQKPWLEAICLSFGARSTTTVDFNKPVTDHPRMRTLSVPELDASDETFDAIFSYSSLEHDGLGRYGDPLSPTADLERMKKLMGLLKPHGKLYLGVPMGPDCMVFNAHRVYGALRFPLLIEGWEYLGTYGDDTLEQLYAGNFTHRPSGCFWKGGCYVQPMHVLGLRSGS